MANKTTRIRMEVRLDERRLARYHKNSDRIDRTLASFIRLACDRLCEEIEGSAGGRRRPAKKRRARRPRY
jgi:hypothetical protein